MAVYVVQWAIVVGVSRWRAVAEGVQAVDVSQWTAAVVSNWLMSDHHHFVRLAGCGHRVVDFPAYPTRPLAGAAGVHSSLQMPRDQTHAQRMGLGPGQNKTLVVPGHTHSLPHSHLKQKNTQYKILYCKVIKKNVIQNYRAGIDNCIFNGNCHSVCKGIIPVISFLLTQYCTKCYKMLQNSHPRGTPTFIQFKVIQKFVQVDGKILHAALMSTSPIGVHVLSLYITNHSLRKV